MRAWRNADCGRYANVCDLRAGLSVAVEDLNPLVAGVGDIDLFLVVDRDAVEPVELAGLAAPRSPRFEKMSVLVELRDACVAGSGAQAVGDIDVPSAIPRDVARAREAVSRDA